MEDSKLPTSKSSIVLDVDAFPFKGLKISEDWKKLDSISNRSLCSICKKSRKYFCYTCFVAVPEVHHFVPILKLPVKIDIIKHAREMDGKSTAVHAAVLAPDDVRIHVYPCIPNYDSQENVVLVFPSKDAVSVKEISETFFRKIRPLEEKRSCYNSRHSIIHRVVFIDSTWNQSRGIFKDPRIKVLPSVVLKSRLSQFWRHQANSPRWYLATIEAIHQFLVELDEAQWQLNHRTADDNLVPDNGHLVSGASVVTSHTAREPTTPGIVTNTNLVNNIQDSPPDSFSETSEETKIESKKYVYSGKYDNLLFFFRFMYSKIHTLYDHDQLRSYKRRLV